MKLITALRAEMLKTKRTASYYLAIIGALPVPVIFMLNILSGGSDLASVGNNPNIIFQIGMERTGFVFFPFFVILICTLLSQIEYKNNTWKQVFTSPQSKGNVFIAKFLNINLLILIFLVANIVFMALVVLITHFLHPELNFLNQPLNYSLVLVRAANAYIFMLAVCSIQFWLGLRFRNFIIPIAVGLILWITGIMMNLEFHSNMAEYFPYGFQTFPFISQQQTKLTPVAWTSVGLGTLFLLLGFLDFRRRRLTA